MGSWAVAIISIWNQWSMRVNTDTPLSSAMRAVVASVGPRVSGAPGRVKLTKWMPTRIGVPFEASGWQQRSDRVKPSRSPAPTHPSLTQAESLTQP